MYYQNSIYANVKFPLPFSNEEAKEYFKLLSTGDKDAKKKLAEHNMRLVITIASAIEKRFEYAISIDSCFCRDDIISIGTIGLMKAIESFDLDKNINFATYASRCIENEILMGFRKSKKQKFISSLDLILNSDNEGNTLTVGDTITSDEEIEKDYIQDEEYREIKEALSCLNERQRKVVMMSYGFYGEKLTHAKIGNILNLSPSYISRIKKIALEKISEYLKENELCTAKTKKRRCNKY